MSRGASRHGMGAARGAATVGVVWVLVALLLGYLVAMLVYRPKVTGGGGGAGSGTTPAVTEDAAYPDAKPITITPTDATGDTLVINPFKLPLSRGAGHIAQWQNNSNEQLLLLVTGAPIGELMAPKHHSAAFRVCVTCDTMSYPYRIYYKRGGTWKQAWLKGPPTEPSIGVGD